MIESVILILSNVKLYKFNVILKLKQVLKTSLNASPLTNCSIYSKPLIDKNISIKFFKDYSQKIWLCVLNLKILVTLAFLPSLQTLTVSQQLVDQKHFIGDSQSENI